MDPAMSPEDREALRWLREVYQGDTMPQLIFGGIDPGNVTTNLMAASVTAGASTHTADQPVRGVATRLASRSVGTQARPRDRANRRVERPKLDTAHFDPKLNSLRFTVSVWITSSSMFTTSYFNSGSALVVSMLTRPNEHALL